MPQILEAALRAEHVKLRLDGTAKLDIIHELVQQLAQAGAIGDAESVEAAVLKREEQLSTGLHDGVAIPHAKSPVVDKVQMALGLAPAGVDFDCVDRQPATIIVLTVSPADRTAPHIRFMATLSRILRRVDVRNQLLAAESAAEAVAIMLDASR